MVLAAVPLIANKNVDTHSSLLHPNVPLTQKNKKKGKGKSKRNAPEETGRPVLWEDRGDLSKLNLFWGGGSEEGQPKPPFRFDKEDLSGTNPKIKVFDADGVKWNIKFDEEVHGEVAASRIVWACGYMVEESYFVRSGKVDGVTGLGRARKFIASDGSFKNGMFEKRPKGIARRRINWTWDANPFVGAKELSGLQVLATMLNNWDIRPANNNVLGMYDDDDKVVDYYIVADWGASFGKMTSAIFTFSKWDLDEYTKQGFIDGVSGDRLKLHYRGKSQSQFKSAPSGMPDGLPESSASSLMINYATLFEQAKPRRGRSKASPGDCARRSMN